MVHIATPESTATAPRDAITAVRHSLADSAIALAFACAGIAMFMPPMVHTTVESLPRIIASGLVIAVAVPLHWVWLVAAVRAMGRRVAAPLAAAVVLFPVGGALALVLLARAAMQGESGRAAAGNGSRG
ncbi:MAG: hypothetical protein HUU30_11030 [Burkholderiaceae bacterium]|nr:hypothetical protein [Aquabacterium sp.]NUP86269.1 hypothetical protein [Burkholderiaceae bacterium]